MLRLVLACAQVSHGLCYLFFLAKSARFGWQRLIKSYSTQAFKVFELEQCFLTCLIMDFWGFAGKEYHFWRLASGMCSVGGKVSNVYLAACRKVVFLI